MVCAPKPDSGPRKDVLNTVRSCMLKLRASPERKRLVNFVDLRENLGLLPYADEEDRCMNEIKIEASRYNHVRAQSLLRDYFITPLLEAWESLRIEDVDFRNLILDLIERRDVPLEDRQIPVLAMWFKKLAKAQTDIDVQLKKFDSAAKKSLDAIIDLYRQTMDLYSDIYTVYRIC